MAILLTLLLITISTTLKAGATVEWISRPDSRLFVNAGQTARINWKFPAGAKTVIYEYKTSNTLKQGKRIANIFDGSPTEIMENYRGKILIDKSGALKIMNSNVADEGFYSITITYTMTSLTDEVEIKIQKAPSITSFPSHPKKGVYYTGMAINLLCIAEGRPVPEVLWYKDNIENALEKSAGSILHTINSASKEDSGKYTCLATNQAGQATRTIEFIIYRRPYDIDFVHDTALDGTIFEDQSVTFTCTAKGSPPISTYKLLHNGKELTEMSKGVYTIKKVKLAHNGTYCCVPINKAGLGENKTTVLRVHERPRYRTEKLKTEAVTYPPSEVRVTRDETTEVATTMVETAETLSPTKGNIRGTGHVLHSTLLSMALPIALVEIMSRVLS